jgi:hypothetical protein
MAWDVHSSSSSAQHGVEYLDDVEAGTAWVSGGKRSGVGESVTFTFPKAKFLSGRKNVNLNGFLIVSGFGADEAEWRRYARPKRLRVAHNGHTVCDVALKDVMESQEFLFAPVMYLKPGDSVRLQVREVYLGSAELPVAVSSLVPLGAH